MKNQQVLLKARPDGMVQKDNFRMEEVSIPALKEGEVLIKNHFISLDPAMRGWMNEGTTYIKGVEIGAVMRAFSTGEVIDSNNTAYPVGTKVSGLLGAQAYAVSNTKGLTKLSAGDEPLSWHLGILGMPGMTAYFGLLERGKPVEGNTVFITGAAGIVGSTVGQIAKLKGCRVVGTAGSATKCKLLTETYGFDAAINYKEQDVKTGLKEHCPDGIDVFFDNVGGPILDTTLTHLARGARVVICGAISQYNKAQIYGPQNYMKIVTARGTLTGIIVFDFIDQYPKAIAELNTWLKDGKMRTKEHIVEGLEQFPEALQMLYTGQNFGKLLLKV